MRNGPDSSTTLVALNLERAAEEPSADANQPPEAQELRESREPHPDPCDPDDLSEPSEFDLAELSDLDLEALYQDLSVEDRRQFAERMLETLDSVIEDPEHIASQGYPALTAQIQELISVRAQLKQAIQAEDQLRALHALIEHLQSDPLQILRAKNLLAPWFEALSELTLPRVRALASQAAVVFRDLGPPDAPLQARLDAIAHPAGRALFCALSVGQHTAASQGESRRFEQLCSRIFSPPAAAMWMRPAYNPSFSDEDLAVLDLLPSSPVAYRSLLSAWLRVHLALD